MFYAAMTQFLGFDRGDEYKVMGLAALGQPNVDMGQIIDVSQPVYHFNDQILAPQNQSLYQCVFDLESKLLDQNYRRLPGQEITQSHKDFASSTQNIFERAVINLVRMGIELCGSQRVCLAGGSGLNCSANGRLILDSVAQEVYVPPFPNDSGCAYGAAAVIASELGDQVSPLGGAALGPAWENDEIEQIIRNLGCKAESTTDLSGLIADEIASGQTVGWFQGRMEAGPRALGMRSILADPRSPVMRNKINREIKYREDFRPFAPSVMESAKAKYFDLPQKSPYMSFVCNVLEPDSLPAITHTDQTARIQTVDDENSPFSSLIEAVGEKTGVPIVLNTSFNVMGQPIVCTPRDAVAAFFSTGLNVLALGNWVLRKK
jgi:carbamoyltransferase